jgi:flagellar protein FliS
MTHPASNYRQQAVQGATPLGMVVMLYDGAIAGLQRAITAIEAYDIEKKCAHLNRALSIIAQLEGTLDFERGGEVAQTLKQFYVHARACVLQANIQNSKEILAALVQQFVMVREAWDQVDHSAPAPPAPSRPPTPPSSHGSQFDPASDSPSGSFRLSA